MDRNDQILLGVLIAAVVAAGLLAIAQSHDAGSAADWAAAVFTGGAVLAAVWSSGMSFRQERERRKSFALMTAHKVVPHVINIKNRIDKALAYVETSDGGIDDIASNKFLTATEQNLVFRADIPDVALSDAWAFPPELAANCLLLQAHIRQYHEYVEGYRNTLLSTEVITDIVSKRRALDLSLERVAFFTKETLAGLAKILNAFHR